jgi:hypothetical protein
VRSTFDVRRPDEHHPLKNNESDRIPRRSECEKASSTTVVSKQRTTIDDRIITFSDPPQTRTQHQGDHSNLRLTSSTYPPPPYPSILLVVASIRE